MALAAAAGGGDVAIPVTGAPAHPAERLFHRGHAWVEPRADGTFDVGVDDLLQRCLGTPDRVRIPGVGTHLQSGAPAVELQRGRVRANIAAPLTGVVVATADYEGGRLYRVQPTGDRPRLDRLLAAREARIWMMREYEMLQGRLSQRGAPTLADGGELVGDLMDAYPDADWDDIMRYAD